MGSYLMVAHGDERIHNERIELDDAEAFPLLVRGRLKLDPPGRPLTLEQYRALAELQADRHENPCCRFEGQDAPHFDREAFIAERMASAEAYLAKQAC